MEEPPYYSATITERPVLSGPRAPVLEILFQTSLYAGGVAEHVFDALAATKRLAHNPKVSREIVNVALASMDWKDAPELPHGKTAHLKLWIIDRLQHGVVGAIGGR